MTPTAIAFVIRSVIEETSDRARMAVFSVDKRGWDDWWAKVTVDLDPLAVAPVASESVGLPQPMSCMPDNRWDNGSLDEIPGARSGHTAVRTGTVMLVWGGSEGGKRQNPRLPTELT